MIVFTPFTLGKIFSFHSVCEISFRDARAFILRELTWKALFVARRQECGGWRDGWRDVPGGYHIRLHPVARRKLQDLLLLLAASPSTSARRERFHGRQEADPAHVFPSRFRFRVCFAPVRPTNSLRDHSRPGWDNRAFVPRYIGENRLMEEIGRRIID